MYETVSGKFYTNAGSGEFIAGPDVIATEVSEWLMARRMGLMRGAAANGWHKLTLTADQDYLKGDTTIGFIRAALPSSYRYAVALADNTENPENNTFLGAIFLPTRTNAHGLRWRNGAYSQIASIDSSSYDLILRQGGTVSVLWRDTPIADGDPVTGWGYACIQPGEISRANVLKTALAGAGTWNAMLSVADLDFGVLPATDQTYCESITLDSTNLTGTYIRTSNDTYAGINSWSSAYSCIVSADTKIACFYL